jgi:UDP-N-acetyl-D-mannosaminuronic acid dehydrogenase
MGLGYIGLPTAALLAKNGYQVCGVDVKKDVVDIINDGKIHISEPDLDGLVSSAVNEGLLIASTEPKKSDIFIIAVPTPFHLTKLNQVTNTPVPNIDYIINATINIAPFVRAGNLILLESTSPIGTTEMISKILKKEGVDSSSIYIAHSPERVLPGQIIKELVENDRIVGGLNAESTTFAADFYRTFVEGDVVETNAKTAEMTKLTENSFRDVNIAFANELSILCDNNDIDVRELISLANKHPRVSILTPGCGVGGHCISVDPWFIVDNANGKAKLIEQARRTNDYKAEWVVNKIKNATFIFENIHGVKPTICIMGLTFKPNIDDLRESPALHIASKLHKEFNLVAVEPNIKQHEFIQLVDLTMGLKSDICVYLVSHKQFNANLIKADDLDFCGIN